MIKYKILSKSYPKLKNMWQILVVTLATMYGAECLPSTVEEFQQEICPGLSYSSCGPDYHYPFDDTHNEDTSCGRPKALSVYPSGWASLFDSKEIKRVPGISGQAIYLEGTETKPVYMEVQDNGCIVGAETCPHGFTVAFWVKPFFNKRQRSEVLFSGLKRSANRRYVSYPKRQRQNVMISLYHGENGKLGEFTIKTKMTRRSRKARESIVFAVKYPRAFFKRRKILYSLVRHQIKIDRHFIPDNLWTHVIAKWDSVLPRNERLQVYINQERVYGKMDHGKKVTGKKFSFQHGEAKTSMFIGSLGPDTAEVSSLAMDELQIWRKPLTKGDIGLMPIHPGCPQCWKQYKGRCFHYIDKKMTYDVATEECKLFGAHMYSIEDNFEEHELLDDMTSQGINQIWIQHEEFDFATFVENVDHLLSSHESEYTNTPSETGTAMDYIYNLAELQPEFPRDDPNVPTLDFSSEDYALDDYTTVYDGNITEINDVRDTCYIKDIFGSRFQDTVTKENCEKKNMAVCQYDINECAMNLHNCGVHECVDLKDGFTCVCPRQLKWNGVTCQGSRDRNDYCSIVSTFSSLMTRGFCEHNHFKNLCPEQCLT